MSEPICNGPHGDEELCPVHGAEIRAGRGRPNAQLAASGTLPDGDFCWRVKLQSICLHLNISQAPLEADLKSAIAATEKAAEWARLHIEERGKQNDELRAELAALKEREAPSPCGEEGHRRCDWVPCPDCVNEDCPNEAHSKSGGFYCLACEREAKLLAAAVETACDSLLNEKAHLLLSRNQELAAVMGAMREAMRNAPLPEEK